MFSYLPSLLPFSVATALTRTETSVQVLDPSQWARQTAPLPEETQVRSVAADETDTCDERSTFLLKGTVTSVSQYNQVASSGIVGSDYRNALCKTGA